MQEGFVVLDLLLPTDEQATGAIKPGVSSLDDLPPRTIAGNGALVRDFIASAADMWRIALRCQQCANLIVIIAFAQTHALGPLSRGHGVPDGATKMLTML